MSLVGTLARHYVNALILTVFSTSDFYATEEQKIGTVSLDSTGFMTACFMVLPETLDILHFRVTSYPRDVQDVEGNWTKENRHEAHRRVR